jgi:hypothetical protein
VVLPQVKSISLGQAAPAKHIKMPPTRASAAAEPVGRDDILGEIGVSDEDMLRPW